MSAQIIPFGRPKPEERQPAKAELTGPIGAAIRQLAQALSDLDDDRLDDATCAAEVARNCIEIALQRWEKP